MIDPGHDRLEAKFATGPSPSRVVAGADAVWVTNADGASVSRIDRATHAVQQISVGGTPAGIALSDGAAWVADSAHGTVAWIPTDANRVVHRTRVGIDPTGVAATPGAVWVANSGARSIQRIDPATGSAGAPIDVGAVPTRRGRRCRRTVGDERARPDADSRRSAHRRRRLGHRCRRRRLGRRGRRRLGVGRERARRHGVPRRPRNGARAGDRPCRQRAPLDRARTRWRLGDRAVRRFRRPHRRAPRPGGPPLRRRQPADGPGRRSTGRCGSGSARRMPRIAAAPCASRRPTISTPSIRPSRTSRCPRRS